MGSGRAPISEAMVSIKINECNTREVCDEQGDRGAKWGYEIEADERCIYLSFYLMLPPDNPKIEYTKAISLMIDLGDAKRLSEDLISAIQVSAAQYALIPGNQP